MYVAIGINVFIFFTNHVVPTPTVSVKVLDDTKPTVGNPVSLGCEINLPKGLITSDINIEWKANNSVIQRDEYTVNDTVGYPMSLLFTYNITKLHLNDINTVYYCQVDIHTANTSSVKTTGNLTIIGM